MSEMIGLNDPTGHNQWNKWAMNVLVFTSDSFWAIFGLQTLIHYWGLVRSREATMLDGRTIESTSFDWGIEYASFEFHFAQC
jgi:hypothetical protein